MRHAHCGSLVALAHRVGAASGWFIDLRPRIGGLRRKAAEFPEAIGPIHQMLAAWNREPAGHSCPGGLEPDYDTVKQESRTDCSQVAKRKLRSYAMQVDHHPGTLISIPGRTAE